MISWGDVKTTKSGKRSAISIYVSEKHIIVYTSTCIESAKIEQYHSYKQLNYNLTSCNRNEEDYAFYHQLEKWDVEKLFSYHSKPVKGNLISYIEDW